MLATTSHLQTCPSSGGCGKDYYNCPSQPDTSHAVLSCSNFQMSGSRSDVCGESFRLCTNSSCSTREWNQPTQHSVTASEIREGTDPQQTVEREQEVVPNTLACGHAVGSEGIHLRVCCEFCSEQFYFCAEGSEHGLARCPRNDKGETCTVSGGRMILCADPPHVHQYPSDPKQTQAEASPTSESHTFASSPRRCILRILSPQPHGYKTPRRTNTERCFSVIRSTG
ncbi:MAG: hypothetical protein OXN25_05355 [Candidatus Poribacteria bacterium]|nr:hypothetical protein [Candidatus Poribacteria bacterium]